jgi:hypothetical protein
VIDRSRQPGARSRRAVHVPVDSQDAAANGLALWTVQHRDIPLQTMVLLVRVGSSADPADRPGWRR